jgi:hypothetical protein
MPLAIDRKDKMWSASNLNDLYSRFDNKCSRTLDGKTPFVVGLSQKIPFGVQYDYSRDPDTSFYVSGSTLTQTQMAIELSKLEVKYQDKEGGQVYLDKYVTAFNSNDCNIAAIQKSFELHKRTVDGIEYDVHLGWDDWNSGYLSYVRSYFSSVSSVPSLPPGRIHKHKIAVAEIRLEGVTTFKIQNSYQRFDCWRVHNCGSREATVLLQLPDGSAERKTVPAMGCRSFRRRADGTWATTWRDKTPCVYFFPYFSGDIPYFAGGPPMYGQPDSLSVCIERSAKANNIANPFIALQWMRAMGAWVDARYMYDIRAMYPEYADPSEANTKIGDAIFTWGRARVQIYSSLTGEVFEDYIRFFTGTTLFLEQLNRVGINVKVSGDLLVMTSKRPNAIIRIYPIDSNVFFGASDPYWQINPTTTYISIAYPEYYYTQNVASPNAATQWIAGNVPTWMETMRDLRRRIAVEEGFLNNYDDVADISEEKVGIIKLTPLGLQASVSTARGIENYDANAFSDLPSYERTANVIELRTDWRAKGFSPAAGWTNGPYIYAKKTYIIAQPSNYSGMYGYVFPQISTQAVFSGFAYPAVNCAYVPSRGPWGFSSSVYDYNLQRVFTTDPLVPAVTNVFGSDFWINKWGGKKGIDASVRILGQPNKTIQSTGVADDVFKDQNNAAMACLAPWYSQASVTATEQAYIADIRWIASTYFNLPYNSTANAIGYDGIGQLYHKIPKSAFLWNLLEAHVGGWNRSVPLAHGEDWCPIYSFGPYGDLQKSRLGAFMPKNAQGTCLDAQFGPSFLISPEQYNSLIANGIQAKQIFDNDPLVMDYYYLVTQIDIATYCSSKGFKSFNFDVTNEVIGRSGGPSAPATAWIPKRAYGFGETVVGAGYTDATSGPLYRTIRLVDLDVA